MYVEPGKDGSRPDILWEYFSDGSSGKLLGLTPWINSTSRCIVTVGKDQPSYKLISLKTSTPSAQIVGKLTLITAYKPTHRLFAREITLSKVSTSKIRANFSQPRVEGSGIEEEKTKGIPKRLDSTPTEVIHYGSRNAIHFNWFLPDDLNANVFKVNFQLQFNSNLYKAAYGSSADFEYLIGRGHHAPYNGHLLQFTPQPPFARRLGPAPAFTDYDVTRLNLQMLINGDWITLLNYSGFLTVDHTNYTHQYPVSMPLFYDLYIGPHGQSYRADYISNDYIKTDIASCPTTSTLMFSPIPPNTKEWRVQYSDATAAEPNWHDLANSQFTGHTIIAPVDMLSPGKYQYRIQATDVNKQPIKLTDVVDEVDHDGWTIGEMTVTHGGSLSAVSKAVPQKEVVRPLRQQTFDRWDNVISSISASGHMTQFEYNGRNKQIAKVEPAIEITKENGKTEIVSPRTDMIYDLNDHVVALCDPNGHMIIHERDLDGKTLKTIRADGVYKIFIPDIFGRTKETRDPLGNSTQYYYDRCDREILRVDACGWKTKFSYNEIGDRLSVTNGNDEIERYDYLHPGKQPTHHYLPGGDQYLTLTRLDRNNHVISEKLPDGRENFWETDNFGNVISHTDLSGVTYTYKMNDFYPTELQSVKSHGRPQVLKGKAKKTVNTKLAEAVSVMQTESEQYQTSFRSLLHKIKDHFTGSSLTEERHAIAKQILFLTESLLAQRNIQHNAKTSELINNLIKELIVLQEKNNEISIVHGKQEKSGKLHNHLDSFIQDVQKLNKLNKDVERKLKHAERMTMKNVEPLEGVETLMPNQDIVYHYDEASHLIVISDYALPIRTQYRYDHAEFRVRETFIKDGHMYQAVLMKRNQLDWLIEVQDTVMRVRYSYDSKGNRRSTKAAVYWDGQWRPVGSENWYTYTEADNMSISRGLLINDKIDINDQQGSRLRYDEAGRRAHEITMKDGRELDKQLFYLRNNLLETTVSDGKISSYGYDKNVPRRNIFLTDTTEQSSIYDANSRVIQESYKDNAELVISTITTSPDLNGLPHSQTTELRSTEGQGQTIYTGDIETTYVSFDTDKVEEVAESRQYTSDTKTFALIKTHYDPNANLEWVEGNNQELRRFITNSEGRIIQKTIGHDKIEFYFYTTNGEPLARFGNIPHELARARMRAGLELTNVDFDLNYHSVSEHFPPPVPSSCTVLREDTFESISERMYGDKSFANLIADVNGYRTHDRPTVGQVLQIPSTPNTNIHNWEGQYSPYNSAAIIGSLSPSMPIPQQPKPKQRHASFWHVFVEAIVGTVLMAFAPELSGVLVNILGEILGEGLGFAIAGAASSLARQELAIKFGDQHKLSWQTVGQAALMSMGTAGLSKGLGVDVSKTPGYEGIFDAATKNIELAIAVQVLSLATGQQRHFDWQAMLTSIANTLANIGIEHIHFGVPTFNDVLETTSAIANSIGVSKALGAESHAEVIAAEALGSFIGNQAAAQAKKHYAAYKLKKELEAELHTSQIPTIREELEVSEHQFIQSVLEHPHEHGDPHSLSTRGQAKNRGDVVYKNQPKKQLETKHAEQEARMSHAASRNAEHNKKAEIISAVIEVLKMATEESWEHLTKSLGPEYNKKIGELLSSRDGLSKLGVKSYMGLKGTAFNFIYNLGLAFIDSKVDRGHIIKEGVVHTAADYTLSASLKYAVEEDAGPIGWLLAGLSIADTLFYEPAVNRLYGKAIGNFYESQKLYGDKKFFKAVYLASKAASQGMLVCMLKKEHEIAIGPDKLAHGIEYIWDKMTEPKGVYLASNAANQGMLILMLKKEYEIAIGADKLAHGIEYMWDNMTKPAPLPSSILPWNNNRFFQPANRNIIDPSVQSHHVVNMRSGPDFDKKEPSIFRHR